MPKTVAGEIVQNDGAETSSEIHCTIIPSDQEHAEERIVNAIKLLLESAARRAHQEAA